MNKMPNDQSLMTENEAYAEAKRLIQECRENNGTALNLSNFMLQEIPPEISELKALKTLYIGSIDDKWEITTLPPEMGKLKNLECLNLMIDLPEIPDWVGNLENLEFLNIYDDAIETVPASISNLKNLRELWLRGYYITSIPDEIGERLPLHTLKLWCPKLKKLPESLAHLKKMSSFGFYCCNVPELPDFICDWTELTQMEIIMDVVENDPLKPPRTAMKNIPRNIGNLKNLKHLEFRKTSITQIPDFLADCPLEDLIIAGNFKTIPETFGKLSKLEKLRLYSPELETLPDLFRGLSSLKVLSIKSDKLSALPQSFCELRKLHYYRL